MDTRCGERLCTFRFQLSFDYSVEFHDLRFAVAKDRVLTGRHLRDARDRTTIHAEIFGR